MKDIDVIQGVLKTHRFNLLQKKNVVAVGIGYKKKGGITTDVPVIVCSVTNKVPVDKLHKNDIVPVQINGVTTDVQISGELSIEFKNPKRKHRPIFGGISVGHYNVTAGTIGRIVENIVDGRDYILSNNHVIANSNNASIGDPVLQPGVADGGTQSSIVATLYKFVPIKFSTIDDVCKTASWFTKVINFILKLLGRRTRLQPMNAPEETINYVDCALAKVIDGKEALKEINGIKGEVKTLPKNPQLGMTIKKSGRTTGVTDGVVTQIDVTASVSFGGGKIAIFADQFATEDMSAPGDSGSLAVTSDNRPVGLLFAGGSGMTIYNRYDNVKNALEM